MSTYISSNANRYYAGIETSYGQAATVGPTSRYPAIRLQAQQVFERPRRLDKTGTRTFFGGSKDARRHTAFETRTYLTSWNGVGEPAYGPLIQAALGSGRQLSSQLSVASVDAPTRVRTTIAHGLLVGSAISFLNEIRFITTVPDAFSVVLNAPFSNTPSAGANLASTITYTLATMLPSLTLYDYWDPITTVSRIVTGAAIDTLGVSVNGDFHELLFSGPAADLLDSSSFTSGSAGLSTFPPEPEIADFDYSIVPGHLGQVWLGSSANQFFTLTNASIQLKNNIEVRNREFGASYPRAIVPGPRQVTSHFSVLAQDDAQTTALYSTAKQRGLISAMLQLGQQQGQLMAIYLPAVTPEIPHYDDSETRLQWQFNNNIAQGTSDDELYIAFA